MTDIVKKLRDDASITSEFAMTQDDYTEAADTIETLRQRVKELDGYKAAWIETAKHRDAAERELAALKQSHGEPEIWVRDSGDGHWEFSEPGFGTPLYTAPPTCFSAADMADAAAKAAQVEREECARLCDSLTEGFAATTTWDSAVMCCAEHIRMRS